MLKSNSAKLIAATVATLLFGGLTYWVVDISGGTKVEPGYSNTPNATVPGPPEFK
ncbi:MAG TPA: hypothetical protein VMZ11_09545 [Mycobacteriales bacterium]|nr:hypothetical protein [Mycobacteriales bacterium]